MLSSVTVINDCMKVRHRGHQISSKSVNWFPGQYGELMGIHSSLK